MHCWRSKTKVCTESASILNTALSWLHLAGQIIRDLRSNGVRPKTWDTNIHYSWECLVGIDNGILVISQETEIALAQEIMQGDNNRIPLQKAPSKYPKKIANHASNYSSCFPSMALIAIMRVKHATLIILGGASVKAKIHALCESTESDIG